MAGLLLDTHAVVWYLESSPRLCDAALTAIRAAATAGQPVYVSAITVVELVYLVEKGRFPASLLDQLLRELRRPAPEWRVAPLDLVTAETVRMVPGSVVRDRPARIIAATAVALDIPLATRDAKIQSAGIPVIW